jgi:hypothetical protein
MQNKNLLIFYEARYIAIKIQGLRAGYFFIMVYLKVAGLHFIRGYLGRAIPESRLNSTNEKKKAGLTFDPYFHIPSR